MCVVLIGLIGVSSIASADAILFTDRNFGGESRTITSDTPDLGALGFDDKTSSLIVESGNWTLYRRNDYQGVSVTLGPGRYPNIETVNFPNNKLSSIRLDSDGVDANMPATSPGLAAAPKITLYKNTNFSGGFRDITGEASNLGQLGFDNETSSLIVHSGIWTLYRNSNFGETPDRPSVTIGPGQYANIEAIGFPGDKLSSVRGAVEITTDTLQSCPAPYMTRSASGGCEFSCADGTVPDPANDSCACQEGFTEIGSDNLGRRRCAASLPSATAATGTLAPAELGQVLPRTTPEQPPAESDYVVSAGQAFRLASQTGFQFRADGTGDCSIYTDIDGIHLKHEATPVPIPTPTVLALDETYCGYSLFGGRALNAGWRIIGSNLNDRPGLPHCDEFAKYEADLPWGPGMSPFEPYTGLIAWSSVKVLQIFIDIVNPIGCVNYPLHVTQITLRGPADKDWREAFSP